MSDTFNSEILNSVLPYCFFGEVEWFKEMGTFLPDGGTIIVLGAGPGIMLMALLEGNPTLEAYGIDRDPTVLDSCRKHLAGDGVKAILLQGDTSQLANYFEDRSADFIVVDSDHSYSGVKSDIEHYWPKLKADGLMFFHDVKELSGETNMGTRMAINEALADLMKGAELTATPGISEVYRKPTAKKIQVSEELVQTVQPVSIEEPLEELLSQPEVAPKKRGRPKKGA